MTTWYQLTPVDTLFFRGAEPLEAGQLSQDALFPPPVSVIQGALRTTVLKQHNISFANYRKNSCPQDILNAIGPCGQPAPFQVTAILLAYGKTIYVPCPANWFAEAGPPAKDGQNTLTGQKIHRAKPSSVQKNNPLQIHSSTGTTLPMVTARDPKPLTGHWLRLECLKTPPATIAKGDLLTTDDLYDVEPRIGIAIDAKRSVIKGRIYSAGHIRLREDVNLVIGLDQDPGLADHGHLTLGGEQRICGYTRCLAPELPQQSADLFVTLAPCELTDELLPFIFAAAKPVSLAGWDLNTGFHKPTTTWLPAGAVLTKNINASCIPFV